MPNETVSETLDKFDRVFQELLDQARFFGSKGWYDFETEVLKTAFITMNSRDEFIKNMNNE